MGCGRGQRADAKVLKRLCAVGRRLLRTTCCCAIGDTVGLAGRVAASRSCPLRSTSLLRCCSNNSLRRSISNVHDHDVPPSARALGIPVLFTLPVLSEMTTDTQDSVQFLRKWARTGQAVADDNRHWTWAYLDVIADELVDLRTRLDKRNPAHASDPDQGEDDDILNVASD